MRKSSTFSPSIYEHGLDEDELDSDSDSKAPVRYDAYTFAPRLSLVMREEELAARAPVPATPSWLNAIKRIDQAQQEARTSLPAVIESRPTSPDPLDRRDSMEAFWQVRAVSRIGEVGLDVVHRRWRSARGHEDGMHACTM